MKAGAFSSAQQRMALFGLSAVIILWVYGSVVAAVQRQAGRTSAEVREARERLRALEASTANEGTLRQQYEQLDQSVQGLRRALPGEEELPAVLEVLSGLASQAQVKIQTIFPQRPLTLPGALGSTGSAAAASQALPIYKEVLIQIDALSGYHQLGTFLGLVETGKRPMQIASLRISANPKETKRHTVKLLLRSYFVTNQGVGSTPAASNTSRGGA